MKINIPKAILAGIVATLVFDLVGFALTGTFWDIPKLLGSKLFEGSGLAPGVFAHYANGVLLAMIYAGLAPSLKGNRWARATTFIVAQTVFGVYLFMMPLLGAGPFGLHLGIMFPIIALVRHLAYGVTLAAIYPAHLQLGVEPPQVIESNQQSVQAA
jgi:hypothetical protein